MTYLSTKERCAAIRKQIKAQLGLNSRQVSVRKDGGSISITIKVPVSKKLVKAIAQGYQTIHRCQVSHEILGGGNTFVFVSYDSALVASIADTDEVRDAVEKATVQRGYDFPLPSYGVSVVQPNGSAQDSYSAVRAVEGQEWPKYECVGGWWPNKDAVRFGLARNILDNWKQAA